MKWTWKDDTDTQISFGTSKTMKVDYRYILAYSH